MNRVTIIIVGLVIIAILLLSWAYLLFFGAPQEINEVFTDLGLRGGPTEITTDINGGGESITQLAINDGKLVQLSTKSVAGFVYISKGETGTSTPTGPGKLRYAERGTGHVYEINLADSTETRISGTTVGQTVDAVFNSNGETVVLRAEDGENVSAAAYLLGANTTKKTELPVNSNNFYFSSTTMLRYGVADNGSTVVYEKDLASDTTATLWTVPFTDINIIWTERGAFVVNKPSPWLKSGVYLVNGGLRRIVTPQYALSAVVGSNGQFLLYSAFDSKVGRVTSHIVDNDTGESMGAVLFAVPEKCLSTEASSGFLCASSIPLSDGNRDRLNEWYRGELISSDTIWKQSEGGSATYIDNLAELSGFDIDVTDLTISPDGSRLFFRNKINDTLWMYRIGE